MAFPSQLLTGIKVPSSAKASRNISLYTERVLRKVITPTPFLGDARLACKRLRLAKLMIMKAIECASEGFLSLPSQEQSRLHLPAKGHVAVMPYLLTYASQLACSG